MVAALVVGQRLGGVEVMRLEVHLAIQESLAHRTAACTARQVA